MLRRVSVVGKRTVFSLWKPRTMVHLLFVMESGLRVFPVDKIACKKKLVWCIKMKKRLLVYGLQVFSPGKNIKGSKRIILLFLAAFGAFKPQSQLWLRRIKFCKKTTDMNFRKTLQAALFGLFLPIFGLAQGLPCIYTLELKDAFGQGWNGAVLEVQINGRSTAYSPDFGAQKRFFISVFNNDTLSVHFLPGTDNNGVAFDLLDPEGKLAYTVSGPFIPMGQLFRDTVTCPSCPVAPVPGIQIDEVRASNVAISWQAPDPAGLYLLEIDTVGFTPGKGRKISVLGTSTRIFQLRENTGYDVYLSVRCAIKGDTSKAVGPIRFKTRWANDVGVSGVTAPESGCGLGVDSVKVGISNYGGTPQSLIPFGYAVNGQVAGVDRPKDGLFTGVIGMDSTGRATFDKVFNFSAPGEYLVQSWTELKADSLKRNDTSSVLVVHAPTIALLPYFTTLDAGFTGWYAAQNGSNSSWGLGIPRGQRLSRAFSGSRAWTTVLKGGYNDNELSFLVSPCFDFSSVAKDPTLSFAMRADMESCCDGSWVEWSTDGGVTWSLLGNSATGVNWYNNTDRQVWSGNGGGEGWFVAAHPLPSAAGKKDVRLRFVLRSDFSRRFEGVALDNIRIAVPTADLAAVRVRNNVTAACGSDADKVVLSIGNLGDTVTTNLKVAYQINNGSVVRETIPGFVLAPRQQKDYAFNTAFSSLNPGEYHIRAWVEGGDGTASNDTIFFSFLSILPIPLNEDFERGTIPNGWSADPDLVVGRNRNAPSLVVSDNLFGNDRVMQIASPAFGLVTKSDNLVFEYRFVDFLASTTRPTVLGPNDRLEVQVSTDCGSTYATIFTVNAQNHTPSVGMQKRYVSLAAFAGKYIRVRFQGIWGSGDYFLDLDNIQVVRCPPSLNLSIKISPPGVQPRTATVVSGAGTGPFTYNWNIGGNAAVVPIPGDGTFRVTVTDQSGCTDSVATIVTGTNQVLELAAFSLFPNPTTNTALLEIKFEERQSGVILQMFSSQGQVLENIRFPDTDYLRREIDLGDYPPGAYFIRISSGGKSRTEKLLLLRD